MGCVAVAQAPQRSRQPKKNVLIVGDSVSGGYISYVKAALANVSNVQHGPDNTGGGMADGAGYGALCSRHFVRTPHYTLPSWDVITFNYGLHDGADTNASYTANLASVADTMVETANLTAYVSGAAYKKPARLIYFLTTIPGGANSVPGEPVSPTDKRVIELNALATVIMAERNITTVDLYKTMTQCGQTCSGCKPHCPPAGYEYLVSKAIVPSILKALGE